MEVEIYKKNEDNAQQQVSVVEIKGVGLCITEGDHRRRMTQDCTAHYYGVPSMSVGSFKLSVSFAKKPYKRAIFCERDLRF